MNKVTTYCLWGAITAGVMLRIFSVSWNGIPHGDINLDAAAAQTMYDTGTFRLAEDPALPPADQYLIQHPPVWALLGTGLMKLTHADSFTALKIASLLSGLVVLALSYVVARRFLDNHEYALILTAILSVSWLMIDFSGNGALYSLHAAWFLLWLLVALKNHKHKSMILGLITGAAYLTNYQAIILIPASVALMILEKRRWQDWLAYALATAVVVSPWLLRNHLLFGKAFFGHTINSTYLYLKAGGFESADYTYTTDQKLTVLTQIFTRWLPFNLYFAARKLFILAPVLFVAFAYAWQRYLFSWQNIKQHAALLLVLLGHLAISVAWPVMKFRYFVPLLPLVLLMGTAYVLHLSWSSRSKRHLMYSAVICQIILSAMSYHQIPTHTYYYDGAITQDAFHGEGELEFMREQGQL